MSLTGVSLGRRLRTVSDAGLSDSSAEHRDLARVAHLPRPRRPRRRVLALAAGVAASVLVVAGVLSDLHVRSELGQARLALGATRARLAKTLDHLSSTQVRLLATTDQRDTLGIELKIVAWELAGAESALASTKSSLATTQNNLANTQTSLADANTGLYLQGVNIATLNTCLAGVEKALNQIAVNDQRGAVNSLSAVAVSCQAVQGQGAGAPVFPFDFPDPDVLRVGAGYYAYATNSATGNVQMIRSGDLVHWSVLGDALPHVASWERPGATWAPGVIALNGGFAMYYTALDRSTGRHCISVATAAGPGGPFVDNSTAPVVCQQDLAGSIDPNPFVDAAGTAYLTWRSQGANGQPPTIWSQQLSPDGLAMVGNGPTALLRPSQRWEGGIVEGPAMVMRSGHYLLFYSANDWNTANYAIGVATCQGPTGPCSKPLSHPIVGSQALFSGPGGPSVFSDANGGLWIAFHAWLPTAVSYPHSRLLFIRTVSFDSELPVVH